MSDHLRSQTPEVRQLVTEHGEVFEYKSKGRKTFVNEKWSVYFWRSVNALADANPSRTAHRLFLYLLGDGLTGNELIIDKEALAERCNIASSLVRRGIRELCELNVLLILRKERGLPVYRFNPRIIWHGSISDRPIDLTPYPEIGRRK